MKSQMCNLLSRYDRYDRYDRYGVQGKKRRIHREILEIAAWILNTSVRPQEMDFCGGSCDLTLKPLHLWRCTDKFVLSLGVDDFRLDHWLETQLEFKICSLWPLSFNGDEPFGAKTGPCRFPDRPEQADYTGHGRFFPCLVSMVGDTYFWEVFFYLSLSTWIMTWSETGHIL